MLPQLRLWMEFVKQFGLGGLWMVLGLASKNDWVRGWLIGMAVVHTLLVLLGLMEKVIAHVGGGINSAINAEAEKSNQGG